MSVSIQDVRHALDELGKLRFGEMRVEDLPFLGTAAPAEDQDLGIELNRSDASYYDARDRLLAKFDRQFLTRVIAHAGVAKALRKAGFDSDRILRVGYQRNKLDVEGAVNSLLQHKDRIKAVVMVPTYGPAAAFIKDLGYSKPLPPLLMSMIGKAFEKANISPACISFKAGNTTKLSPLVCPRPK